MTVVRMCWGCCEPTSPTILSIKSTLLGKLGKLGMFFKPYARDFLAVNSRTSMCGAGKNIPNFPNIPKTFENKRVFLGDVAHKHPQHIPT